MAIWAAIFVSGCNIATFQWVCISHLLAIASFTMNVKIRYCSRVIRLKRSQTFSKWFIAHHKTGMDYSCHEVHFYAHYFLHKFHLTYLEMKFEHLYTSNGYILLNPFFKKTNTFFLPSLIGYEYYLFV